MASLAFRFLLVFFAGGVVLTSSWGALSQPPSGVVIFSKETVSIISGAKTHEFQVELALTPQQHMQGLMFRQRLGVDAGMLFVYRREAPIAMWMKNTYLPLDMLFISRGGIISKIAERTVPLSEMTISSGVAVIAVLELNSGTVSRLGITLGDKVIASSLGIVR